MIYKIEEKNVKFIGRTYFYKDALWCGLSGSGISFTFTGTKASITLVGDDSARAENQGNYARVAIYIDNIRRVDTLMDVPEKTFCVYESETAREVTIQVIKLSECAMSTVGIKSLEIESEDGMKPLPEKARKIEFIGDSITCGYGVDLEVVEGEFSTATEDMTRAYAYKIAKSLDADYSMVSFSGYGIVSGYTDSEEKSANQLVPSYYDKVGFSYAKPYGILKLEDIPWDFSCFRPELIVINLGTNDDSYCKDHKERQAEFKVEYVKFLQQVREYNPNAAILCCVGIMGERIYEAIDQAVCEFKEVSADRNIFAIKLTEQLPEDGYVTHSHPTERSHEKAALVLTKKIQEIMNW